MSLIKSKKLLEYSPRMVKDDLEIWLEKSCEGEQTRKDYRKYLMEFLSWCGVDLQSLLETWANVKYTIKREQFEEELGQLLNRYSIYLKRKGYAPLTIKKIMTALLSFFRKYKKINVDYEFDSKKMYVKFHNRDITKEEIRKILELARIRDKAFFIVMLESGLRPDTLCRLKYKHIKEDFEKGIIPMKIDLPSELLKDKVSARWSFIGEDGYRIRKEY